jgi:F420-dependent oxidoreductase-like protein
LPLRDVKGERRLAYTSAEVLGLPLRERVGVSIEAGDVAKALGRVHEAEDAGVRQVWLTIGGAGRTDSLTFYAAAAAQTSSVRLGTSIVPIYPRHPLVTIQQALAVADLAPDRLRLGLGPSHHHIIEGTYGLPMPSPLAYLREYVSVVRGGLRSGNVQHHGKFFNVTSPLPRKAQIPVLTSALGVKAFRLAGEISDGAISWLCPVPYLLNSAIPSLRSGAEAQGRPTPPLVAHVLVSLSTDKFGVRGAVMQRLQSYLRSPFYRNMFSAAGLPVAPDGSGLNVLADSLVVSGNEDTVKSHLTELLKGGLDELLLTLVTVADEERERSELLSIIGSL